MPQFLDIGAEEAHFTGREFLHIHRVGGECPQSHDFVFAFRGHEPDAVAQTQSPVHDTEQYHNALIGIVPGIENQRFERSLRIALRGGESVDHRIQHLVDIQAGLGGNGNGIGAVQPYTFLNFRLDAVGIGARQIYFIQYGHDFMIMIQRQIDVGQRLGLYALSGVHHQQRTVAGCKGAGNFIIEVHMPGGVDEIEDIGRAVLVRIGNAYGLCLDGDAAFALQIHLVEILVAFLTVADETRVFKNAVGQCGLAVVDVSYDAEIADMFQCGHGLLRSCFCRNREWRVFVPAS